MYSDPDALRAFMDGMHVISYDAGVQFSGLAPELARVHSIVDVGGASGAFLIAVAQSFPALHGVIYDLPPVRPIAEEFVRAAGMADRITFHAGNFWEDPIPDGADAYSLGFVLHDWHTGGGSLLLEKVASAARPAALLIIGEYLLNDDRTGPLHVARQDLNMLVAARGRERTAREYEDWIREFGFALRRIQPTSHGKHFLIAERV